MKAKEQLETLRLLHASKLPRKSFMDSESDTSKPPESDMENDEVVRITDKIVYTRANNIKL